MLEIKDIEKLAKLSRIELSEPQKTLFLKEIGAILGYVDQIKTIVSEKGGERKIPDLRNVTRFDEVRPDTNDSHEAIIAEFPDKQNDYLKVKKILGN